MPDPDIEISIVVQSEERSVDNGNQGLAALRRRPGRHRRPRRWPAPRPRPQAERRRRGRTGRHRLARRSRHPAALHRSRDGPGRAGAVPGGEARHRAPDHRRLLLRLRRARAVHPGRPRSHRDPDAQDRQGGAEVRPSRGLRRRRTRGAGRRAVQARADRPQVERGRCSRRRERRGRRGRALHLRQPQARRVAGLEGPLPRSAPCPPPSASRRSG